MPNILCAVLDRICCEKPLAFRLVGLHLTVIGSAPNLGLAVKLGSLFLVAATTACSAPPSTLGACSAVVAVESIAAQQKIDVSTFGARPDDDEDDVEPIRRAYAAAAHGDVLVFPAGLFRLSGPLVLQDESKRVSLRGAGVNQTTFIAMSAMNAMIVNRQGGAISDLSFLAANLATSAIATDCNLFDLERVSMDQSIGAAVQTFGPARGDMAVKDVEIIDCGQGLTLTGTGEGKVLVDGLQTSGTTGSARSSDTPVGMVYSFWGFSRVDVVNGSFAGDYRKTGGAFFHVKSGSIINNLFTGLLWGPAIGIEAANIEIANNTIRDCHFGITLDNVKAGFGVGSYITLGDTDVHNNTVSGCDHGIWVTGYDATIRENTFEDSLWSVYRFSNADRTRVENNVIRGCGDVIPYVLMCGEGVHYENDGSAPVVVSGDVTDCRANPLFSLKGPGNEIVINP
jgi:hypothetical protein